MSNPAESVMLRAALTELADSSEQLRAVEASMDSGEAELGEEDVAVMVHDRYLSALETARRLTR